MQREYRFSPDIDLRQITGQPPQIRGYAARFNSLSHPIGGFGGGFVEKIRPGAFRSAIAEDDVRALVNHDASKILGRSKAGTLTLREDADGLYCEIQPPDTTTGRDTIESISRGDLDGMSFGFGVPEGGDYWSTMPDGKTPLRELRDVRLFDVSVVTYPAYPATSVAMRSLYFPDGIPAEIQGIFDGARPSPEAQRSLLGQPGAEIERLRMRLALARRL